MDGRKTAAMAFRNMQRRKFVGYVLVDDDLVGFVHLNFFPNKEQHVVKLGLNLHPKYQGKRYRKKKTWDSNIVMSLRWHSA